MTTTSKTRAVVLLGAAFLLGAVAGGAAMQLMDKSGGRPGNRRNCEVRHQRVCYWAGELQLTTEQQESMLNVYRDGEVRMDSLQGTIRPAMDSLYQTIRPGVDSQRHAIRDLIRPILTPEPRGGEATLCAHAIVLHTPDTVPCDKLIQEICEYLNEYDDEGDGRWLPATDELVEKVARDPSHRQLLGLPDIASSAAGDCPAADVRKTLGSLGQRGHVVLRSHGLDDAALGLENAFHAGVGTQREVVSACHVILNPELMGRKCIAHIIGDIFLEWLHGETHRDSIQDIR